MLVEGFPFSLLFLVHTLSSSQLHLLERDRYSGVTLVGWLTLSLGLVSTGILFFEPVETQYVFVWFIEVDLLVDEGFGLVSSRQTTAEAVLTKRYQW